MHEKDVYRYKHFYIPVDSQFFHDLFQFLSLKAGDERNQLVPVLTTMLKLSQEERAQLQFIAQGIVLHIFEP